MKIKNMSLRMIRKEIKLRGIDIPLKGKNIKAAYAALIRAEWETMVSQAH